MKKTIMNIKYIWLLIILLGFSACNSPEDVLDDNNALPPVVEELEELTAGSADFSKYVSLGNSLTSGLSDGTVFLAAQQNSYPKLLSEKFALVGGGDFTQPLVNDNYGGLALNGNRIASPRLVTTGGLPKALESVIGPVTVTTDILLNNPTGPFNNMGVPLAKSFHLLAPGYGNIANFPTAANPYFIRMTGSTPDASVLSLAMAQTPSFFSLWIGNNDVLGYATSGGDGSNPITPVDGPPGVGFNQTYGALVATLTSGGAKGVVANIPYVTDIAHFTAVAYNPLDPTNPDFGPQIPTLNQIYGALNQVFAVADPSRIITFSTTQASAVVIIDEDLVDLSGAIAGALGPDPAFAAFITQFGLPAAAAPQVAGFLGSVYGRARQATANDLLVLPSSSIIGQENEDVSAALAGFLGPQVAAQFSVEGVTLPLEDKWVLTPQEQNAVAMATSAYNTTITSLTDSNPNVAVADLRAVLEQASTSGYPYDEFIMTTDLVTGGLISLDGVHLTSRGYGLMAREFLVAIDEAFGSNFIASGTIPDAGDLPTNYNPALQ
jgi:lysophospholipase L1-like esterase